MAFSSESLIRENTGLRQAHASERGYETRRCFNRNRNILEHLFQPLGIETEFLGHLDQFLRGIRILDGFGELPGSVGLFSVMVGLGHRSTFLMSADDAKKVRRPAVGGRSGEVTLS